jgi:hypothetical protein
MDMQMIHFPCSVIKRVTYGPGSSMDHLSTPPSTPLAVHAPGLPVTMALLLLSVHLVFRQACLLPSPSFSLSTAAHFLDLLTGGM